MDKPGNEKQTPWVPQCQKIYFHPKQLERMLSNNFLIIVLTPTRSHACNWRSFCVTYLINACFFRWFMMFTGSTPQHFLAAHATWQPLFICIHKCYDFSSPACSQTTPMQFPHDKHALSSFLCSNCAERSTLCSPYLSLTVSSFIPQALLV